jgi:biotin carboxylase
MAAELAARHGLPHPDPAAVRACRDKESQRRRLRAAGLPGPAFQIATTPADAVPAAAGIGLPVVVKPVAGSGSIGIRLCESVAAVRAAAAAVLDVADLALPPQRAVLVEEYLRGPEFSVETFDDRVIGVTAKHLGALPYFVETGHDFPAAAPSADLGATALAALRALGLGWGAAHVEIRRTTAGPRVIEVNPRLAGGMIPRLVVLASGIDLIESLTAKAAGIHRPIRSTRSGSASIRFLVASSAGRLAGVDGESAARAVPGVVEVGITGVPGQVVVPRHSFQDRLGYVIASTGTSSVAARAAEDGLRRLAARITPADLATESAVG